MLKFSQLLLIGLLYPAPGTPDSRMIDDFSTAKKWVAEVINAQQQGPLFHVGVWSEPQKGPDFSVRNGEGYFHFPQLESWIKQGFECALHLSNPSGKGLPMFDSINYLSFTIINRSAEPVWMKFRLLEDMSYVYGQGNELSSESALAEMTCNPDTFIVRPNSPPQKIRIRLNHPVLKENILSPVYKNELYFIAFETRRTIAPNKKRPTIDCTLIMDNLEIENGVR